MMFQQQIEKKNIYAEYNGPPDEIKLLQQIGQLSGNKSSAQDRQNLIQSQLYDTPNLLLYIASNWDAIDSETWQCIMQNLKGLPWHIYIAGCLWNPSNPKETAPQHVLHLMTAILEYPLESREMVKIISLAATNWRGVSLSDFRIYINRIVTSNYSRYSQIPTTLIQIRSYLPVFIVVGSSVYEWEEAMSLPNTQSHLFTLNQAIYHWELLLNMRSEAFPEEERLSLPTYINYPLQEVTQ